jgi:hypothetical protein
VKIEKIHDVLVGDAVHEITDDAAAEEAEADLYGADVETEGTAVEENGDKRAEGEESEKCAFAGENGPGGAGVADVDQIEEVGDDGDVLKAIVVVIRIERDGFDDPELGELIEGEQAYAEAPEEAVRLDTLPAGAWAVVRGSVYWLGRLGHSEKREVRRKAERIVGGESEILNRC